MAFKAGDGTGFYLKDSELRPERDLNAPTPKPLSANESVWPKGSYGAIPTDDKIRAALGYREVTNSQLADFAVTEPQPVSNETLVGVLLVGLFFGFILS